MKIVYVCISKTETLRNGRSNRSYRVCMSPLSDTGDECSYDPVNYCTLHPLSKREFAAFKVGKTYPMQRIKV